MIHQTFPATRLTVPNCRLPPLLLPFLALLALTAILITSSLRSRRHLPRHARRDPEHHPSSGPISDAKHPLPSPPPPCPSSHPSPAFNPPPSSPSTDTTTALNTYAASYAYTHTYTDDLPPPLRSTVPIPLSTSGRPLTSADLVRSPWWRRQYVLGRRPLGGSVLVGDGGGEEKADEGIGRVRVTETRAVLPLTEEVRGCGVDGEADGGREDGERQVKHWRRRRVLVFEGLHGCGGGEGGGTDGDAAGMMSGPEMAVKASDRGLVDEADVWAAMRGVEIEI